MIIHEMTETECREALAHATLGRLACSHDNQPYVVPIYFKFDGNYIYAFSTVGQKIEWMRSNPRVCLEIDERIDHANWMSVIVFGCYEELPDDPRYEMARLEAQNALQQRVMWWEPAIVAGCHRETPKGAASVVYRIHIKEITGHRAASDRATPDRITPDISGDDISLVTNAKENWWNDVVRWLRA